MPTFVYHGFHNGQPVEGRIRAEGEHEAERRLIDQGIVIDRLQEHLRLRKLRESELIQFTRGMASLLRSGITLDEAGELWTEDSKHAALYRPLFEQVREGVPFSEALAQRGLFPEYLSSMVRIGEATGTMPESFTRAADYLEAKAGLRRTMVSALFYPAIVLLVAAVALIILFVYVLPVFEDMYRRFDADLPMLTQALIGTLGFLRSNGLFILLIVVVVVYAIVRLLQAETYRMTFDRLIYRLPLIGPFTLEVHQAFFCQSMGHLLAAGVGLLEALDILTPLLANRFLAQSVRHIREQVARGQSMAAALAEADLFGKRMPRVIHIAERSGRLGESFADLGRQGGDAVDAKLKTFASLFEPLLILSLACIIGLVLVALYLPMFDIVSIME